MKRIQKYILAFALLCSCYNQVGAQNSVIDSLLVIYKSAKEDTSKVKLLNALSQNFIVQRSDTAIVIAKNALLLAQKLGYQNGICQAFNNISQCYSVKGNDEKQIEFLLLELKIREAMGDKKNIVRCYYDIGSVYRHMPNKVVVSINYFMDAISLLEELLETENQKKETDEIKKIKKKIASIYGAAGVASWENGMYSNAIKYQLKSLNIYEDLASKKGLANTYNNIGIVYDALGNYEKAIEYNKMALSSRASYLKEELKNLSLNEIDATKNAEANSYNNLGVVYEKQGNLLTNKNDSLKKMTAYNMALENMFHAEKLFQETKNASGIPMTYDNLGNIYSDKGDYVKAMEYFLKALRLRDEKNCGNCKLDYAVTLISIGTLYYKQNNWKEAEVNLTKALKIADELGSRENTKTCCEILSKINFSMQNYKMAYVYLEKYSTVKDSLINTETFKQIAEMNTKYETDKKENQIVLLEKDKEKQEIETKKQKVIMYAVSGGLCLVLFLALFIFRGYRQKKIAHNIISKQKHLVEEKQKEIIDSINYAERIQRSFMATKELLNDNLNDYFVFFKPKDVVSGDFYWASKLNNGKFAFVTADSTGHGVPGAIMSLLNVTSLEKAIETETEPEKILNATRKIIIERLKKDGSAEGGKDGMDASLTVYDFKNKKLTIAASNNPVWIARPFSSGGGETKYEVIEIKPDKMPIGKHDKDIVSFTQQEIDLHKGDVVYTLTDGFPDQFGGKNGKKFMNKNLRELLVANSHLPMQEQKELIEKTFADWVGNLEQVDDVTLIGVKI